MFDIFSCSNWKRDLTIRDGYGEYLAYPKSGSLTREQFEQFHKITEQAKKTYPESIDKVLKSCSSFFKSIENTFGVSCPQIPLSARNYWVQYQLNQANCPVKVFFLPQTFYDILTTHTIFKNDNWEQLLSQFPGVEFYGFHEHLISDDQFSDLSTKLAFKVNLQALAELKLRNQSRFLTLEDLENWASSSFKQSPWYPGKCGWEGILKELDPTEKKFSLILKRALELECSVYPTSTLIYRGSKPQNDATGSKYYSKSHSLSYGTSLFAGGKNEQSTCGATPWIYCLEKGKDCLAIEIQARVKSPFFIPRRNLQMLSYGELFHPRTKIPEVVFKSRGHISGAHLGNADEGVDLNFIKFQGSPEELADLWKSFQEKAIVLTHT